MEMREEGKKDVEKEKDTKGERRSNIAFEVDVRDNRYCNLKVEK